jgi:transposase, IS5 family
VSLAGEVREADQRARILAEIDAVLPWDDLCALIGPHYPERWRGRLPV